MRSRSGGHGRGRPPLDETERKRILDATAAVFLEKGFARAATSEIARRARTSKQTLYGLFPTKADLFVGVIGSYTGHLFDRHVEYATSDKPVRESLNEMGCMMLGLFADPKFLALYRIVVAEVHNFPKLARQLWTQCTDRGYRLLAEFLKSHHVGGPAYRRSAEQFISVILGDYLLNALLNPDAKLSARAMRLRVEETVEDFLHLYPLKRARGQE